MQDLFLNANANPMACKRTCPSVSPQGYCNVVSFYHAVHLFLTFQEGFGGWGQGGCDEVGGVGRGM